MPDFRAQFEGPRKIAVSEGKAFVGECRADQYDAGSITLHLLDTVTVSKACLDARMALTGVVAAHRGMTAGGTRHG